MRLAVRVFRLAHAVEVPMTRAYAGCQSWIMLLQFEQERAGGHVLELPAGSAPFHRAQRCRESR